jgi:hypothetical protein
VSPWRSASVKQSAIESRNCSMTVSLQGVQVYVPVLLLSKAA